MPSALSDQPLTAIALSIPPLTVEIADGDIAAEPTDAVVNAANNHFWMGAGVAGALKARGGASIERRVRGPDDRRDLRVRTVSAVSAPRAPRVVRPARIRRLRRTRSASLSGERRRRRSASLSGERSR